jgi:EmrB/QacA subfamily drug resistance transporter
METTVSADSSMNHPPALNEEIAENPHRWLVMAAVGVGSLLSSIDNNVVNIALPTIRHQFGADVARAEWVVASYLLAICSFLLTFGRLGDMHGQKPIYIWGFFTFVASSALCGLAPSISMLIVFRAVQGIGASMLLSSATAILANNFPASQRGRVLGLQVLMVYIGSMTGPSLGGWLTDHFSWRAVFYINVPIGLTALYLSTRYIPRRKPSQHREKFDFAGAAMFATAFSILILALNQGHAHGWVSPYIVRMFTAAILLLATFLWIEKRAPHPLLDLSMFRVAQFSLSTVAAVCNYISMSTLLFLMPFYLIQGYGLSSSHAGLLMTIQPVLMVLSAPSFGAISDRIGTRWPAMIGTALTAAGMLLLSRITLSTPLSYIGIAIGLAGLGTGIFVAPNNSTILGSAPTHRRGIASGVLATARYTGMILGVGISGAIFTTSLSSHVQTGFLTGIQVSFMVAGTTSLAGCIASAARE